LEFEYPKYHLITSTDTLKLALIIGYLNRQRKRERERKNKEERARGNV